MCQDARPMKDIPAIKIFPQLALICPCCFNKQKKKEKVAKVNTAISDNLLGSLKLSFARQESSIQDQQDFKSKIQEAQYRRTIREYPFLLVGRGVEGWLQLIATLIQIFAILSFIACVQIYLLKRQAPDYMSLYTFTLNRAITSLSMGTIYQSEPQCAIVPTGLNHVGVSCDGRLQVTEIIDFGPIREKSARCYFPRDSETGRILESRVKAVELADNEVKACQDELQFKDEISAISKECIGKKSCSLKDLKKLFKPDGECIKNEYYLRSHFYLQVSCGKSHEQLREVNHSSLLQASLGVGGCLLFILTMKMKFRWQIKLLKRQSQSYSQNAKDYTLEFPLTPKQTEYFDEKIYPLCDKDQSYGEAYMENFSA